MAMAMVNDNANGMVYFILETSHKSKTQHGPRPKTSARPIPLLLLALPSPVLKSESESQVKSASQVTKYDLKLRKVNQVLK